MVDHTIARIDVFKVGLPYSGGVYMLSGGREYRSFDSTIVRITTKSGIEGWGETCPFGSTYIAAHALGVRAAIAEIAPKLINLDPRKVDRMNDAMNDALMGNESAKAALDIACWDIFGKLVGLPVCELLGGSTGEKLPIIDSITVGTPKYSRDHVTKYREAGYIGHSVKIDGEPVSDAARIKAALEDQKPGEFFLVDANGGMNVETALRMLNLLPPGLDFVLEAPCATSRKCLSLRRRTKIPIIHDELATDERTLIQMIADDAVEGIGMKITKNGGLTRCRRIRDICLAAGYVMSVQDTVGSDISFAAIVHMGQTIPERNLRCVLGPRDMVTLKTADGPFDVKDGYAMAPDVPGLGIQPRLDVLGEAIASYT
ncbi:Hypothetical protein D9617_4g002480 [Elsinoe fawcettii]|nr:Hypothetical protein D9617_4g002480 [Elsinoe fawcettii]